MTATLTIRLDQAQRLALKARAQKLGKTESDFVRGLIAGETARGFDFEKVRHLAGSLESKHRPGKTPSWRRQMRERNWRP